MKNLKTFFATIALLLCCGSASAHDFEVDGIYYNITDSEKLTVEVTYRGSGFNSYSNEYSGDVVIPESVTYASKTYAITSIGWDAFAYCSSLTSVTIPNSVTSIGSYAFYGCSSLTSTTIPNRVTSIGYAAFSSCSSLISVTIPNSVTSIGISAFSGCSSLTSVTIGNGITSIGDYAFEDCSNLTSVHISDIAAWCNIKFSSSYSNPLCYAKHLYMNGKEITELVIPDGVTSIGNSAFYGWDGLTSVTIGNSVTSIGYSAFYGCDGLTLVTIGNGVTSIGTDAFYSCENLRTVVNNSNLNLAKGSSSNGYVAYYAYRILTGEPVDGFYFEEKDGTYYLTGYVGDEKTITLPNSYKWNSYSIGKYAFRGCSNLTSVTIGNSVTSIGNSAFYDCDGLTTVTIGNSVTSIGDEAFNGCDGLTLVTIGNGVTSIEDGAFGGCSSLKTMVVGAGVLSIGYNQTTPVKTIWLTNTPPSGYSRLEGVINYVANEQYGSMSNKKVYKYLSSMFEVDGITYVPVNPSERTCDVIDCNYDSTLTDIKINETVSYKNISMNVKEVMPYAFYGNKYIKTISLNNNGGVGEYAFNQCTSLKEASISNNGSIGSKAFYNCTALQNATISNKGNIGSEAFYYCTALQNAAISNNGSIDSEAFYNCKSLTTATLGDSIKSLGGYAFSGCKLLKEIIIPNAVKSIGEYCFKNCSAMNKAIIGGSVETINKYAFTGCASLPELTIPKSTTSIDNYAFSGCTGLKKFVIEDRETTLKLGSNGRNPLFADCPLDYMYIGGDISYSTSSSYGYSPFYRNTSLREVVITDKETEISANEFYGCTNLQNFTVGDGVTTFGDWAFSGCSSLKKLSFGSQLKTIGKEAFSDCVAVTEITSKATTPPTCGSMALDDINKWECTLNIPKGCSATYQAAEQWKEFFFITEGEGGEPVEPDTPEEKVCATPTISYINGELVFESETEDVVYLSTITDSDINSYETKKVQLNVTYNISVYATKEGYKDSEVAKATLCWIDVEPKSEGLTNTDIANVKALPVVVQASNGTITVTGADDGTMVEVYGISGAKLGEAKTAFNTATIHTDAQAGCVVIVKVGNKAIKIKI